MWSDCVYIPKNLRREYSPTFPLDMDHFWPHVDNPYMDPYGYGICSKIHTHTHTIIHQFFFVRVPSDQNPTPTNPKKWIGFFTPEKKHTQTSCLFPLPTTKKIAPFSRQNLPVAGWSKRWIEGHLKNWICDSWMLRFQKFQTLFLQMVIHHARIRKRKESSWWFQPIWKILGKLDQIGWFPQVGLKIKNLWNDQLEYDSIKPPFSPKQHWKSEVLHPNGKWPPNQSYSKLWYVSMKFPLDPMRDSKRPSDHKLSDRVESLRRCRWVKAEV